MLVFADRLEEKLETPRFLCVSFVFYGRLRLRKSQSGGQPKVRWFIFQSCCAAAGKKTTERFILSVGQFERVDIISHLYLIEGGLHFFFFCAEI